MSVNIYNKDDDKLNLVAGGILYADSPIGSIVPYGGASTPYGWLVCQGQAVSRAIYAELFAVIGTAYGSGDGSTTFNIPDLRETIPVGVGENDTQTISNHDVYTLGAFKDDNLGRHDHPLIVNTRATYNTAGVPVGVGNNNTPTTATHGKQLGVNYIIKAKQVAAPADFMAATKPYIGEEIETAIFEWNDSLQDGARSQEVIITEDNWYFIQVLLSQSSAKDNNTFTFSMMGRDGEYHTLIRQKYTQSGEFITSHMLLLKAGTYHYSHSANANAVDGRCYVYMNRRDFA